MSLLIPVWIYASGDGEDQATRLARKLGLPVSRELMPEIPIVVTQRLAGGLCIAFTSEIARRGAIDLGSPAWFAPDLLPRHHTRGRDPLMRAIGFKTNHVVDCTAGWGVDAVHISQHGISVDAVERHPIVAALLQTAWQNTVVQLESRRLQIHCGDAATFLRHLNNAPEVVYLDPMYPSKSGTAASRRPLQLLQALHANDLDNNDAALLQSARRLARRRVVVKRPVHAPPLAPKFSGSINGKLVRFDLYPPLTRRSS